MITKDVLVESMQTLAKNDLMRLSAFQGRFCISIYIPTHQAGIETLKGEDALILKNQIKEIRIKLAGQNLSSRQTEELVKPVMDLVNDADFWRHQMDGLTVFVSDDFFEKYVMPVQFEPFNYLSTDFYIKPLLPLFSYDSRFHLLTLKKDSVRLYKGDKYAMDEVDISTLVPSRLEDVVGYDYEQKQVQVRSLGTARPGSFHGHGEAEAKDKNELLLFFREVDRGIMSRLNKYPEPPLVLCCLDYYFPIYREASSRNIYPKHVSFNPADLDRKELHAKTLEILQPHFGQNFERSRERFLIAHDKGKASSNIREIIPAAMQGRIDTVFLRDNFEIYGIYDQSTGGISITEDNTPPSVSLTNFIAKKVFENGGKVYVLDKAELPDNSTGINALYRY